MDVTFTRGITGVTVPVACLPGSDWTNVAIEPESITEVDYTTRDAWVAETVNQTRGRLDAFESGDAPFCEEATEAYGEDVSAIEAAVASVDPIAAG